jgi:hypothetical protein
MARSVAIKVDRLNLISALEDALKKREADYEAAMKQYKLDRAAWDKNIENIKKDVLKKITVGQLEFRTNYDGHSYVKLDNTFIVDVNLNNAPREPHPVGVEHIKSTLKVLKLSVEPTVPASFYQNVVDYLL